MGWQLRPETMLFGARHQRKPFQLMGPHRDFIAVCEALMGILILSQRLYHPGSRRASLSFSG
jgi:hypothetical protein